MSKLKAPTWLAVLLAVVAGVLEGLNVAVFGFSPAWQYLVTIGLAALAAVGISPLTGTALQTALHLSHRVVLALGAIFSTAVVAVTQIGGLSTGAKGILVGVLTLLAGVLFGTAPAAIPVPVAPVPPARAR